MNVYFLSLGGNAGDRAANLRMALSAISTRCGRVVSTSSIYEAEAWGMTGASFLNQVVKIESPMQAEELMRTLMEIEAEFGRRRDGHGYTDRTIDIDILFMNAEVINRPGLHIPHPRLHERKFVLLPMREIASELIHPVLGETIASLEAKCTDTLQVVRLQPPR
jgi:2-amino-4-hydroxy-6-hydroxymethyldihydropteridine diphosphokinase